MNTQYSGFAGLYDIFMSGTDYTGWVNYIEEIFARFNKKPVLMLDLGCGTGKATRLFSEKGYDMIGLDNSPEMLAAAKAKDPENLYILQDIRSFELYGTVDAVISLCDVFNYLLTAHDLSKAFRLVKNYLNPGGLFIFDMNTEYKYSKVLAGRTFARETNKAAFIWNNRYYPKQRINEYRLTFFNKRSGGLYERFCERHLQRAYSPLFVRKMLECAGLKVLDVFGNKTFSKPRTAEKRIFFVAQS
jgi:SAM-dependent methyltransferase